MLCIAVTKNSETGKHEQIMNIAVPKHLSRNENAFIEDIQVGDTVLIEIIGKKYELKNTSISSIGKVIVDKSREIKLEDTTSILVIPDDEDGEIETIDDEVEVDSFSEHSDVEEPVETELSYLDDEDSDNVSEDSVDEY